MALNFQNLDKNLQNGREIGQKRKLTGSRDPSRDRGKQFLQLKHFRETAKMCALVMWKANRGYFRRKRGPTFTNQFWNNFFCGELKQGWKKGQKNGGDF